VEENIKENNLEEEKLRQMWGKQYSVNLNKVKQVLVFLGLCDESGNSNLANLAVADFFLQLNKLGELLLEDKKFKTNFKDLNLDGLKEKRLQLYKDKEFLASIYNANHANHKKSLEKLYSLSIKK
jgi:hypothetical protein